MLPFTPESFFSVFARYNQALWPAVVALWVVSACAVWLSVRPQATVSMRFITSVLAVLWAWGGVVYHLAFFAAINPAARVFAAAFALEGAALGFVAWRAISGTRTRRTPWRLLGTALMLYGLAYPAISILTGHAYPATPTFGVPCPTTILTVGWLVTVERLPWSVAVIPTLWSLIGGSAAVLLGVPADFVLLACAPILGVKLWRPA